MRNEFVKLEQLKVLDEGDTKVIGEIYINLDSVVYIQVKMQLNNCATILLKDKSYLYVSVTSLRENRLID